MNKETYTEWFKGLNARLADGTYTNKVYERLIIDNLQSLIVKRYNDRHNRDQMTWAEHYELINHYFEMLIDAPLTNTGVVTLLLSVRTNFRMLPAARELAAKHKTTIIDPNFLMPGRLMDNPGLLRKVVVRGTETMVDRPVITQVNEADDEMTIALPWKLALHVYKGFLVKELMANHDFSYHDAYKYITDHYSEYDELLDKLIQDIITHKESHLVSVGGGITAAGTGLVVSGVIKPEE
ncbi:DNA-directed RNA polymerase subunit beta' [Erwinia phage AH06]|nr:DNA-directed RNA polymerase subunit beta' [Erwinia phage AH06]